MMPDSSPISRAATAQGNDNSYDGKIVYQPTPHLSDDGPEVIPPPARFQSVYPPINPPVESYPLQELGQSNKDAHYGHQPRPTSPPRSKTICGLYPTTLYLAIALVIVILIAAVGGGAGGSTAVSNAREDSYRECETEYESELERDKLSFSPPQRGVILKWDCPDLNSRNITIEFDTSGPYTFQSHCNGSRDTRSNNTIIALITYSYEHCLRACAGYNDYNEENQCRSVGFLAELVVLNRGRGNCYLYSDNDLPEITDDRTTITGILVEPED